jgi:hypothetical protein
MKRNTVARLHETDESENDTSESDTDSVSDRACWLSSPDQDPLGADTTHQQS